MAYKKIDTKNDIYLPVSDLGVLGRAFAFDWSDFYHYTISKLKKYKLFPLFWCVESAPKRTPITHGNRGPA
jgi:hypothetical protein